MMKKIVALLLALTFVCFAFASCGDALDGKTFSYEKIEVELENEEMQEALNGILKEGQSVADYFLGEGTDYTKTTYEFKDGKITQKVNGEAVGKPVSYEMDGDNIVKLDGKALPEGMKMYLEDGKLVQETAIEETILVVITIKATVKIIYK